MYTVPQTKANDIIDVISKLPNRAPSNRFYLKQQKRDAEAIAIDSPIEGNTVLGAIACMVHDIDAMHKYHKAALDYSGRSTYALVNYGVSLTKSFFWNDALAIFEEAYRNNLSDISSLEILINACYKLGLLSKSVELLDNWEKLSPAKPFYLGNSILQAYDLIQTLPITEDMICNILTAISKELTITDALMIAFRFISVKESDHQFLHYELVTPDTEQDITELELIVDDILSDKANSNIMDYFCITFCNASGEPILDSFNMAEEGTFNKVGTSIDFKKIEELIKDVEPL